MLDEFLHFLCCLYLLSIYLKFKKSSLQTKPSIYSSIVKVYKFHCLYQIKLLKHVVISQL